MGKDDKLEVNIPYKFEKGGIYLIEVKSYSTSLATVARFQDYFRDYYDVHVHFIMTEGNDFALQAVQAIMTQPVSPSPQSEAGL